MFPESSGTSTTPVITGRQIETRPAGAPVPERLWGRAGPRRAGWGLTPPGCPRAEPEEEAIPGDPAFQERWRLEEARGGVRPEAE